MLNYYNPYLNHFARIEPLEKYLKTALLHPRQRQGRFVVLFKISRSWFFGTRSRRLIVSGYSWCPLQETPGRGGEIETQRWSKSPWD